MQGASDSRTHSDVNLNLVLTDANRKGTHYRNKENLINAERIEWRQRPLFRLDGYNEGSHEPHDCLNRVQIIHTLTYHTTSDAYLISWSFRLSLLSKNSSEYFRNVQTPKAHHSKANHRSRPTDYECLIFQSWYYIYIVEHNLPQGRQPRFSRYYQGVPQAILRQAELCSDVLRS